MPQKKPREGRRHCIPPAPHPRSDWDLLNVPGSPALALWRALRNVLLWGETPQERRARAFRPPTSDTLELYAAAVAEAPALARPFKAFMEMQAAPESVSASDVARACHLVYVWADGCALPGAAAHFAEAAAYVDPEHPAYAVDAGWICRRAVVGESLARSAAWYQRAFVLAVRAKARHDTLRSLTGYGALMQEIGNVVEARRVYLKAARRAARTGRKRRAAVAHHYLFALAAESGTLNEAVEHARRAFRLYPIHDPRLPYLAHDYAFLLVRHHIYRPALRLLDRVLPKIERPDEMLMVLGTLCWAAGGSSHPEQFHRAEKLALELVPRYPEFAAPALTTVAWGARALGKWNLVQRYASMALPLARKQGNAWAETNSRALLDAVETADKGRYEEPADARTLDLARRLAARLLRWRRGSAGTRAPAEHAHDRG